MILRLKSVKHTGTRGEAGTDREESFYRDKIGACFSDAEWIQGARYAVLGYVLEDRELGFCHTGRYMVTSTVWSVSRDENTLTLITTNSIYEFEIVSEDEFQRDE